jgi:hypothetical protein
VYKGDEFDWRRERLSAQLRALAEQADLMYAEFLAIAPRLEKSQSPRTDDLAAVAAALKQWIDAGLVPDTHIPPSAVRFAESVSRLAAAVGWNAGDLCTLTRNWLGRSAFPVSLTLFQVVLGVATTDDPPVWPRATDFRFLVTSELLDVFPAAAAIPDGWRIEMPAV